MNLAELENQLYWFTFCYQLRADGEKKVRKVQYCIKRCTSRASIQFWSTQRKEERAHVEREGIVLKTANPASWKRKSEVMHPTAASQWSDTRHALHIHTHRNNNLLATV